MSCFFYCCLCCHCFFVFFLTLCLYRKKCKISETKKHFFLAKWKRVRMFYNVYFLFFVLLSVMSTVYFCIGITGTERGKTFPSGGTWVKLNWIFNSSPLYWKLLRKIFCLELGFKDQFQASVCSTWLHWFSLDQYDFVYDLIWVFNCDVTSAQIYMKIYCCSHQPSCSLLCKNICIKQIVSCNLTNDLLLCVP